jgi:dinuclear metal center YbgI/SA1388 family protein
VGCFTPRLFYLAGTPSIRSGADMSVTVSDIIRLMDEIAPQRLAEKWDNSGLQIGDRNWPVRSIMVSLDPLPEVVADACRKKTDLLITHHPVIFKPLSIIDFSTPLGSIIQRSVRNKMALFAAHTNLDSVSGGINDMISEKIGLQNLTVLSNPEQVEKFKLVFFVPADHEKNILEILFQTKAGIIGNYTCCSFRNPGTGTFYPGSSARPFSGSIGKLSHADEVRIETVVCRQDLDDVVTLLKKHHPYETMAYDIYPLIPEKGNQGLGRVGFLPERLRLDQFSNQVGKALNLKHVRIAGDPGLMVEKVAVCSGSGSSLLGDFLSSGAQVFISGDMRYHDARTAEENSVGIMDVGHFGSEHLVVDFLVRKLRDAIGAKGMDVSVEACVVYSS